MLLCAITEEWTRDLRDHSYSHIPMNTGGIKGRTSVDRR